MAPKMLIFFFCCAEVLAPKSIFHWSPHAKCNCSLKLSYQLLSAVTCLALYDEYIRNNRFVIKCTCTYGKVFNCEQADKNCMACYSASLCFSFQKELGWFTCNPKSKW